MTREEAKRELRPIKDMEADIKSVELEIERLMTVATKMTPVYDSQKISGTHANKIENALIKIDEYRGRLANLLLESVQYKADCLEKVKNIEQITLRTILRLYYFEDCTMEQIAERIDKTPRWTYELYLTALDEYAKKS